MVIGLDKNTLGENGIEQFAIPENLTDVTDQAQAAIKM